MSASKKRNWIESETGQYWSKYLFIINKQKHQIDKKKYLDKTRIFPQE